MTARTRFLAFALVGALLAGAIVATAETWWREQGYRPTIAPDKDLWSIQRERAVRPGAWALLGASRMQLGFDRGAFETRYPGCALANLTVNGHYPLASLRDLAADQRFNGTALVSVDARAMLTMFHDMQQPWIDHYDHVFSPERRWNRLLDNVIEDRLVVANPDHNLVQALGRVLAGRRPAPGRYLTVAPDGLIDADYSLIDPAPFIRHWAEGIVEFYRLYPPLPPQQWRAEVAPIVPWVRAIEARGGRVVLVRLNTSGPHWDGDQAHYPKERYWDSISEHFAISTLHFKDVPGMARVPTPDSSHVDQRDKAAFTTALLEALARDLDIVGCPRSPPVDGAGPRVAP